MGQESFQGGGEKVKIEVRDWLGGKVNAFRRAFLR